MLSQTCSLPSGIMSNKPPLPLGPLMQPHPRATCFHERSQFARKLPSLHLLKHAIITGHQCGLVLLTADLRGTQPWISPAQWSSGELYWNQRTITKIGPDLGTAAPQKCAQPTNSSAWKGVTSLPEAVFLPSSDFVYLRASEIFKSCSIKHQA